MEDFDDFLEGLDSDKIDNILSDSGDSFDVEPERIYDLYRKMFICLMHPDFSFGEGMDKFKKLYLDFSDVEKIHLTSMFFTAILGLGGQEIFTTFTARIQLEVTRRVAEGGIDFQTTVLNNGAEGIEGVVSGVIREMYKEMMEVEDD